MSYCKSCGAPIMWIRMKSGKMMPVDAAAKHYWNDPQGKDSVVLESGEVIRCSLKGEGEAAVIVKIVCWSFGLTFRWRYAIGIWSAIVLLGEIFKGSGK